MIKADTIKVAQASCIIKRVSRIMEYYVNESWASVTNAEQAKASLLEAVKLLDVAIRKGNEDS